MTQRPAPVFPLRSFLEAKDVRLPKLRVVDVGAMILSEAEEVWQPLQRAGHCASVVGFEPCDEECRRLNESVQQLQESPSEALFSIHFHIFYIFNYFHSFLIISHRLPRGSADTEFRFLPWALGDGARGQFRRCSAAMTSSMLEMGGWAAMGIKGISLWHRRS